MLLAMVALVSFPPRPWLLLWGLVQLILLVRELAVGAASYAPVGKASLMWQNLKFHDPLHEETDLPRCSRCDLWRFEP